MARERTRGVCDGLPAALASYGAPDQTLADNGKLFTGEALVTEFTRNQPVAGR
jgi:hypothetical protein